MTVSSVVVRAEAIWTGAETEFPTGIEILDRSQLVVSLVPLAGAPQKLTLGLHYSVTLSPAGIATVRPLAAFPVEAGSVSFVRQTPMTQTYDPTASDTYDASGHAAALDRSAMRVAELSQKVDDIEASSIVVAGGGASVPAGAVYVSDGKGEAIAGPTAAEVETARATAVAAAGTATGAAGVATAAATMADKAADRAEAAAGLVEGPVSYAVEQHLTEAQQAVAQKNIGLDSLNPLTPFAFTATAGQTEFDLGTSPRACLVGCNGSWLVPGDDYSIVGTKLVLTTAAAIGDRIAGVAVSSGLTVPGALQPAANFADLLDAAAARANLGLPSAGAGTGASQLLKLDANARIIQAVMLASMPSGSVIGRSYAEYTSQAGHTTLIPYDNTPPQITEGEEILAVTYTPKMAGSKLRASFHGYGSTAANSYVQAAMFLNGANTPSQVSSGYIDAGTATIAISMCRELTPSGLTPQTISIRVGPNAATTLSMNQFYGGAGACTLIVEEIMP